MGPLVPMARIATKLMPAMRTRWRNVADALGRNPADVFLNRRRFFSHTESRRLSRMLDQGHQRDSYAQFYRKRFDSYDGDLLQHMTLTDFHTYLPEDILHKVDRASMAVSLEVRVPWLDHRLVEFAFSLPSSLRIKNGRKKHVPKELAGALLPSSLELERKKGFCIPVDEWMRGTLGNMLRECLLGSEASDIIDGQYVRRLLRHHHANPRSKEGARLYAILDLILWYDTYL